MAVYSFHKNAPLGAAGSSKVGIVIFLTTIHSKQKKYMGKDREGKFHPRKGKPSGSVKNEGTTGLKDINSNEIENYLEVAEKYTVGEEEPAPNVRIRHPNRNVDKREERVSEKKDNNNEKNPAYKSKTEMFRSDRGDQTAAEELPAFLTKEQLNMLAGVKADPCISVYLETHQAGAEKNEQKDTIAFKNVLQQITYQLRQKNVEETRIEKILKPGYDLLRDEKFWFTLTKGTAFFMTEGKFYYIRLPFAPGEEILLNTSFYLAPLIPVITGNDYFYLMVLSKKQAKLYRADAFGMVYIPIPEMPNGVDDVVHFENKDNQRLFRTDTSGAGQGANFHGMGSGAPDEKENLAMYFDEVDETAWKAVLNNENVPLLLAGVEYLIPIYKSVAKYKPIWNESLTGNYEYTDTITLYQEAVEIMEPYFRERHNKALAMYGNQSATAQTSSIPADVIPAAYYSKVWHLFVQKGEHLWGSFDELNNELIIHESQQEGDEDLIDKAVIRTLLNGGEVHLLEKDRMPAQSPLAALMRY